MAPAIHDESDWSDSDEEDARSDVETNVLLGIPDGEIKSQEEINDAAVSRIGGRPAFLSKTEPSITSSQCKNCSYPMELLVQLWCPFEDSAMDRALYIFGCARGECQYKPGSIRAFRGLRYNASYAAKLEKKHARQREKDLLREKAIQEEEKRKEALKVNPFSMYAASPNSTGLFGGSAGFGVEGGLGSQLFGTAPTEEEKVEESDTESPPTSDLESEDELEDLEGDSEPLTAPAHSPDSSSPWLSAPAYTPPLYMSTANEYVPPAPRQRIPKEALASEMLDDSVTDGLAKSKKGEAKKEKELEKDARAWDSAMEGYEDSLELDKVFEKFAKIAGYEGEQCIRYELGGTPLPYAHDKIFTELFPSHSPRESINIKPSTVTPARRVYSSQSKIITPCSLCGGPRTFECQLMPNLISVLQSRQSTATSKSSSLSENKNTESETSPGKVDSDNQPDKTINPPSTDETKKPSSETEDISATRKEEVERLLARQGKGKHGMEWGTCMVFSCAKDCYGKDSSTPASIQEKGLWTEELVLVQWEE